MSTTSEVKRDVMVKTYRVTGHVSKVKRDAVIKIHRVRVNKKTNTVIEKELLRTHTYSQLPKEFPPAMSMDDLKRLSDPDGWPLKEEYSTITDWLSASSTRIERTPSPCMSDESDKSDNKAVAVAKQPKKAPRPSAWNPRTSKELTYLFHGLDYTPE